MQRSRPERLTFWPLFPALQDILHVAPSHILPKDENDYTTLVLLSFQSRITRRSDTGAGSCLQQSASQARRRQQRQSTPLKS
jgi:hypothetical protein